MIYFHDRKQFVIWICKRRMKLTIPRPFGTVPWKSTHGQYYPVHGSGLLIAAWRDQNKLLQTCTHPSTQSSLPLTNFSSAILRSSRWCVSASSVSPSSSWAFPIQECRLATYISLLGRFSSESDWTIFNTSSACFKLSSASPLASAWENREKEEGGRRERGGREGGKRMDKGETEVGLIYIYTSLSLVLRLIFNSCARETAWV